MPRKKTKVEPVKETIQEREARGATQGIAGAKLYRMNLGLSGENADYVKSMSRLYGLDKCKFINSIIDGHRQEHSEQYEAIRAILNMNEHKEEG